MFLEAMSWVEEEHRFPEDLADFHARRFEALALRSRLWEQPLPLLVVVTGSCGKASTARFLASILRRAGRRVGLGTKPPVQETLDGNRERYQLWDDRGDHWVDPETFALAVTELRDYARGIADLAPYDLRAWLLLRLFQEWNVDIGIVEANIGLRNDPAGAIPAPRLTVITPIATDHASMLRAPAEYAHLGTAAGPLYQKLSRVRSERVVVGRQPSITAEALQALLQREGPRSGRDYRLEEPEAGLWGGKARLCWGERRLAFEIEALGAFQLENAAQAAVAAWELEPELDPETVRQGLLSCPMPGRLELLRREPLELLCVASSRTKVDAMMESLEEMLPAGAQLVVVATFLDRIHGVREAVARIAASPRVRSLVVSRFLYQDADSRDLEPELVASWVQAEAEPELSRAIQRGRALQRPGDVLLLLGNGLCQGLERVSSNA